MLVLSKRTNNTLKEPTYKYKKKVVLKIVINY